MRDASKRAVRLHTTVIPVTRLMGLAIVCGLMPLHNVSVLGNPRWSSLAVFALAAALYCLGSWLVLRAFFARCRSICLGDLFLVADIFLLLFAVHLTGGPGSLLFVLLAGRCVDQLAGGFRRLVWFNHLIVGSYAAYLLFFAHAHPGEVPWSVYAVKLSILYIFNWYCTVSARTLDSVRARARRAELARRTEAEFAGRSAHSIRASAEGIAFLAELLAQTSLDRRQQHYVAGLAEHGRHVLDRILLLDASAVETSPDIVREAQFPPRRLIQEVTSLLRPLAESKGLDFRVEIEIQTPFSIVGDAKKVRQILLSVTHNAIRFTQSGFVELRCWRLWPGHIVFEVRDSGPGIPAHVQRRVSAGFMRADGTPWHRYHGAQVGLSISKRLAELMGGRLLLQSDPSAGTTARVTLPIRGVASLFAAPALERKPPSLTRT